jgi:hypothetical protein
MTKERPDYVSYLLRLWRENDEGQNAHSATRQIWRASLESSRTGELWGFASLRDLFAFLRRQTGAVEEGDEKTSHRYD